MKFHTTWLLSLCMFILLLPFNTQAATHESGLALTFDDDYVDQWYDYFITNNQHIDLSNVKATFFVSNFHLLSSSQLTKLRALANAGHEIGSHSYSHGEVNTSDPTVNDPVKVSAYLNTQVLPTLTEMVAAGFTPLSFSYPSNGHTNAYDDAIRPYFPFLRAGYADGTRPLSQLDRLYHNSDKYYTFLEGDSIDSSGQNELPEIEAALTRAKNNTEILTLYTHRIQPDTQPHAYGLSVSKLNGVISKAKQLGLRFYTFSEAYAVGPAPNPQGQTGDPNNISVSIESSSRVRVRWNSMPLNDYLGIVPVGSLYWAEGATTEGSSSGNLGISVPGVQAGQAYTAILYYRGNKVVTSAPFVIIPGTSPTTRTLTINKTGTGTGTISSLPAGINCGADCTENYTSGVSVTLTATAAAGSTFSGWSGAGCSGTQASCVVSMTAAQTVTANITANTPPPPPPPSNADISVSIENTNRVRLNWSNIPPHDFVGIVPTSQANWQPGMSGATTNGSVSAKLGITVSEAVAGQTYSAIFYLNNGQVAASTPFTIIPGSTR
ncbi:polysaccharide deacetylase family protein [Thiothrix lacustris]|uniref:polysaccharide deacetylase family protein n=1 Tax=Thiothrix lacustris TaxID=525917 RepID=UPI00048D51FA|nr:polysaccharide deacetylase family protein [Thiothrix lacustris]